MYLHKKNIHRRSPTKYLAGVRVDSCCFYTAGWCLQPPLLLASCWGWSSPGTRPMCKAGFFWAGKNRCVDWHAYNWHIAKGEDTPPIKRFVIILHVWCEWWVWVEPWIPEWPWVIIPGTSSKNNDSKSQVFSDIFVTAPPESCVHVLVQQNCKWCLPQLYRPIYLIQILAFFHSYGALLAWGDILVDDKPKVSGCQPTRWTHVLFDQSYNRALVKRPLLLAGCLSR